jgi:hypothetical protein
LALFEPASFELPLDEPELEPEPAPDPDEAALLDDPLSFPELPPLVEPLSLFDPDELPSDADESEPDPLSDELSPAERSSEDDPADPPLLEAA